MFRPVICGPSDRAIEIAGPVPSPVNETIALYLEVACEIRTAIRVLEVRSFGSFRDWGSIRTEQVQSHRTQTLATQRKIRVLSRPRRERSASDRFG